METWSHPSDGQRPAVANDMFIRLSPVSFLLSPHGIKFFYRDVVKLETPPQLHQAPPQSPSEIGRLQNTNGTWHAVLYDNGLIVTFGVDGVDTPCSSCAVDLGIPLPENDDFRWECYTHRIVRTARETERRAS